MEEFIKLIQDIGFIVDSKSWDMIIYIFGDYKITINYVLEKWLMRNENWLLGLTWDKCGLEFNEIDLLKEHFISYFRDIKIKELGI